jgi:hypothetical protein
MVRLGRRRSGDSRGRRRASAEKPHQIGRMQGKTPRKIVGANLRHGIVRLIHSGRIQMLVYAAPSNSSEMALEGARPRMRYRPGSWALATLAPRDTSKTTVPGPLNDCSRLDSPSEGKRVPKYSKVAGTPAIKRAGFSSSSRALQINLFGNSPRLQA